MVWLLAVQKNQSILKQKWSKQQIFYSKSPQLSWLKKILIQNKQQLLFSPHSTKNRSSQLCQFKFKNLKKRYRFPKKLKSHTNPIYQVLFKKVRWTRVLYLEVSSEEYSLLLEKREYPRHVRSLTIASSGLKFTIPIVN